tara:strand:- start:749 stop:1039 length:291 start_codon:yes stop_codon:yes gene_type:complete
MILLQNTSGLSSLIMFGMLFLVMYFFMIRPQIKKQKKERDYRLSLKKGDSVITIGGIHGKIIEIKTNVFIVEGYSGTKFKIDKNAIAMNTIGIDRK